MTRTSAMRWVKALARTHALAASARVDAVALHERAQALRPSRREVFAGAAAAAAFAGAGFRPRPVRAAPNARIAIVGAGLAGLSAALTLADHGLAATIYEAADRVGGRMHSETSYWRTPSTAPVSEYCGEFIDSGHATMQSLARRFELPLIDVTGSDPEGAEDLYWLQRAPNSPELEVYRTADAVKDFAPVFAAARRDAEAAGSSVTWNDASAAGRELDAMSIYDWIAKRVPGGLASPMGRLLNSAYEQELGAMTTDLSALNIVYALASQPSEGGFSIYGSSDQRFRIEGGNDRLPGAIARYLELKGQPPIETGRRLVRVAQSGSGVVLTFAEGGATHEATADRAILAIPFAVLRTLDIRDAQFDEMKMKAIRELGAGRNAKLVLQYDRRIWNEPGPRGSSNGSVYTDLGFVYGAEGYGDRGPQNMWDTTRGQPGPSGLITNYSGGEAAASLLGPGPYLTASDPQTAQYAREFAAAFDTIFPGSAALWNGRAILSTPFRDPNLMLAYSCYRVGQVSAFSGYEGLPQGLVHFAGEHTSGAAQGYMEGAAQEGQRAALEVVKAVGGG